MAYRMAGMGSRGMAPMMGAGLNAGMGMASPALSGLGSGGRKPRPARQRAGVDGVLSDVPVRAVGVVGVTELHRT